MKEESLRFLLISRYLSFHLLTLSLLSPPPLSSFYLVPPRFFLTKAQAHHRQCRSRSRRAPARPTSSCSCRPASSSAARAPRPRWPWARTPPSSSCTCQRYIGGSTCERGRERGRREGGNEKRERERNAIDHSLFLFRFVSSAFYQLHHKGFVCHTEDVNAKSGEQKRRQRATESRFSNDRSFFLCLSLFSLLSSLSLSLSLSSSKPTNPTLLNQSTIFAPALISVEVGGRGRNKQRKSTHACSPILILSLSFFTSFLSPPSLYPVALRTCAPPPFKAPPACRWSRRPG